MLKKLLYYGLFLLPGFMYAQGRSNGRIAAHPEGSTFPQSYTSASAAVWLSARDTTDNPADSSLHKALHPDVMSDNIELPSELSPGLPKHEIPVTPENSAKQR